jgi:hypothetical protein
VAASAAAVSLTQQTHHCICSLALLLHPLLAAGACQPRTDSCRGVAMLKRGPEPSQGTAARCCSMCVLVAAWLPWLLKSIDKTFSRCTVHSIGSWCHCEQRREVRRNGTPSSLGNRQMAFSVHIIFRQSLQVVPNLAACRCCIVGV